MCVKTKSLTPRRQTFNSLKAISITSASNWVCAADHLATCFLLRQPLFSMHSADARRFPWDVTAPRSAAATRTSQVSVYNLSYLPYCGCCQQPARLTVEPAHRTVSILNYGMRSRDNLRSFLSERYTKPTGSVCAQLCQVCAQDESRLSSGRLERHKGRNTRIRKYFQEVVCSYVWVTAVRWWQPTRDDGSPAEPSRYKMAGNGTFQTMFSLRLWCRRDVYEATWWGSIFWEQLATTTELFAVIVSWSRGAGWKEVKWSQRAGRAVLANLALLAA